LFDLSDRLVDANPIIIDRGAFELDLAWRRSGRRPHRLGSADDEEHRRHEHPPLAAAGQRTIQTKRTRSLRGEEGIQFIRRLESLYRTERSSSA